MTVFGYETQTTFWQDFSIADMFGESAIKDTYNRAFKEWKNNAEYVTELSMVLNWKMWDHYEHGRIETSRLYEQLWSNTHSWCLSHLKGADLTYYIRTTD